MHLESAAVEVSSAESTATAALVALAAASAALVAAQSVECTACVNTTVLTSASLLPALELQRWTAEDVVVAAVAVEAVEAATRLV